MNAAYIFDHVRTPRGRGKPDGSLHEATPVHLSATVLTALRERNGLDTRQVDDIVFGVVSGIGEQGGGVPRVAALAAGFDERVAGVQINRFCGSGLEACNMAAAKVVAGGADLVIAGGCESMSRVAMLSDGGAWGVDPAAAFATRYMQLGVCADLLASQHGLSREQVDAFAVESHRRAALATAEGRFDRSLVAVRDVLGDVLLDHDENVRAGCTQDDLAKLRLSFADSGRRVGFDALALARYPQLESIGHVHHAGNSSGIVDGACAVLIGNETAGRAAGLKPRARIRSFVEVGSEPTVMMTGPSVATRKLLQRSGMTLADIDLFEVNEAFAAVPLHYMDSLGVGADRINVNGGAIALGHPLGATGAMLLGTVLDELERTGKGTALVTLCIAVGMGVATVIERV
ncbi:acetyl-CoA C-acetyltransferase [Pseudomonas sp. NPDC090755]|uniref:acetyl-CoA C-acetyltransferase n=1 Tax=Pseudomonas sp. NPDC090755 TaxID=3364481 RepID=UPI00383BA9CA